MTPSITLELPWPPSVNHYWRHTKTGHYISEQGKIYRNTVYYICVSLRGILPENAKLSVSIEAFPPDKRRRDLDNLLKATLDALQYAMVYQDDYQIDLLTIARKSPLNGILKVTIKTLD